MNSLSSASSDRTPNVNIGPRGPASISTLATNSQTAIPSIASEPLPNDTLTDVPNLIECIPMPIPDAPPSPRPIQTRILQTTLDNNDFGDILIPDPSTHQFRIYTQNVCTMSTASNFLAWRAAAAQMERLSISCFMFQETNIHWTPTLQADVTNIFRKLNTKRALMSTSCSTEQCFTRHQPGGTSVGILGKWSGRVLSRGQDTPLGRWSYQELGGKNGKRVVLISVYRPCANTTTSGFNTAYAQQSRILLQANDYSCPRKKCLEDLTIFVKRLIAKGMEIILSIDANESLYDPQSQLADFIQDTQLIDLLSMRHGSRVPETYQRGSQPIDYCFGTILPARSLLKCGLTGYNDHDILSDHRAHFCDFDSRILFGMLPPDLLELIPRQVFSSNPKIVKTFGQKVSSALRSKGFMKQIQELAQIPTHFARVVIIRSKCHS